MRVSVLTLLFALGAGCSQTESSVVTLSTPEETALALPLISTSPATYEVSALPQHGVLAGVFPSAVYTPEKDFNGTDAVGVRVSDDNGDVDLTIQIEVTPVNDAPVATADVIAGDEDTPQDIATSSLLANDMDVDGDALTIIGVPNVRFGTAKVDGGHITFTPALDFNGTATFVYTVSDGHATAPGVVTVSIGMVNDTPVAVDDFLNTDEDTPLVIDPFQLLGNDSDPDEGQVLTVTAVSNVQGGTASVLDGTVTFTPALNFNGDATFKYTVSDGSLTAQALCTVSVAPVNDAPIAKNDATTTPKNTAKTITTATLLANDSDPDGDPLTVTAVGNPVNGTVTKTGNNVVFTPTTNFTGAASFTYTISDGTLTATATVKVTVL